MMRQTSDLPHDPVNLRAYLLGLEPEELTALKMGIESETGNIRSQISRHYAGLDARERDWKGKAMAALRAKNRQYNAVCYEQGRRRREEKRQTAEERAAVAVEKDATAGGTSGLIAEVARRVADVERVPRVVSGSGTSTVYGADDLVCTLRTHIKLTDAGVRMCAAGSILHLHIQEPRGASGYGAELTRAQAGELVVRLMAWLADHHA